MRITGVVSLRGNGRFIDFNSFEMEKIEYILDNYVNYSNYQSKREFFDYMGSIDTEIVSLTQIVDDSIVFDARINTLNQWATEYAKEDIANELNILSRNGESRNAILRVKLLNETKKCVIKGIAIWSIIWGITLISAVIIIECLTTHQGLIVWMLKKLAVIR